MPSFKFGYHPVLVRPVKITQILPTSLPAALPVSDAGLSVPIIPSIGRRVIQIKQVRQASRKPCLCARPAMDGLQWERGDRLPWHFLTVERL